MQQSPQPHEIATLGGGCFWCVEAALTQLTGVLSVTSGYAGGRREHPNYQQVCSGATGHIEVVQIAFDPARIDYHTLLLAFFTIHDPTTRDRQGHDVGSQYRSVIFTHSPAQDEIARALIAELDTRQVWPAPIVTEVLPAPQFWPAEDYHQDYFARNASQPYCQGVVAPKVAALRASFWQQLKME